jgi:23S rRNA G2445 N2-methylase RlmL
VIEAALKWKAEKSDDCNTVKFVGGDRDAGAIEMANRNAARAGEKREKD